MSRFAAGLAAWVLGVVAARALGPHEIALLVNRQSEDSLAVANHYAQLRNVPPSNIIYLDLPERALSAEAEFTPDEFRNLIWAPAMSELKKRGLVDHILAWIYSAGFPRRILADPPLSLHGLTFTRGVMPPADDVRKGVFRSPLFAGPDKPDGPMGQTFSMEQMTAMLNQNMPMPSMSLALTGSRGLTVDESLAVLKYGLISDRSAPPGDFFYVTSPDVRSEARVWEFVGAEKELLSAGLRARIVDQPLSGETRIMGLMMGVPYVTPKSYGVFMPGALADHLTSFAACLDCPDQSKVTDWLRAGATASAGTVTEPYAIWTKFPNARLFSHYAKGSTALESYYAAVRSPLQTLFVGDPLASPWAHPEPIMLTCLADDANAITGSVDFAITMLNNVTNTTCLFLYFLDGRALNQPGYQTFVTLNSTEFHDGFHELRAVAYTKEAVRQQSPSVAGFTVMNRGRRIRITSPGPRAVADSDHPCKVGVEYSGQPGTLALVVNDQVVAKAPAGASEIALDPRKVGEGPVRIQAVALYDDTEAVRSAPVTVSFQPINRPPVIDKAGVAVNREGQLTAQAVARDEEGDALSFRWFQSLEESQLPQARGAVWNGDQYAIAASNQIFLAEMDTVEASQLRAIRAELRVPDASSWNGIVFNVANASNCDFVALFGDTSAWVAGSLVNGEVHRKWSRGIPLWGASWKNLELLFGETKGMEIRSGNQLLGILPEATKGRGNFGVFCKGQPAAFRDLAFSPPSGSDAASAMTANLMLQTSPSRLIVQVTDGVLSSERVVAKPAQ